MVSVATRDAAFAQNATFLLAKTRIGNGEETPLAWVRCERLLY